VTGRNIAADWVTKILFTPSGRKNERAIKYRDKTPRGIRTLVNINLASNEYSCGVYRTTNEKEIRSNVLFMP
jgi:hypothetical protein